LVFAVRTRIIRPPQSLSAIKTSQVTLECGVERDASVTITWHWYFGSSEISDSRMSVSSTDGSLTIKSVRSTDVGRYTCRVVSITGNDSAAADIKVIGMNVLSLF